MSIEMNELVEKVSKLIVENYDDIVRDDSCIIFEDDDVFLFSESSHTASSFYKVLINYEVVTEDNLSPEASDFYEIVGFVLEGINEVY